MSSGAVFRSTVFLNGSLHVCVLVRLRVLDVAPPKRCIAGNCTAVHINSDASVEFLHMLGFLPCSELPGCDPEKMYQQSWHHARVALLLQGRC